MSPIENLQFSLANSLLQALPHPAMLINQSREIIAANKLAMEAGAFVGQFCWKTFGNAAFLSEEHQQLILENPEPTGVHCTFCRGDACLENLHEENDPNVNALGNTLDTYWVAINKNIYLHYAIDVTEQVETQAAKNEAQGELKRNQQLLAEMGKIGKVGGWDVHLDTGKNHWTEEVYHIHEVSLDFEPTVERGLDFYSEASKPVISAAFKRAIENGEPYDVELEIITAKGNSRNVRAIGTPDIENRRIFGFFQDITKQKKAEEERENLIAQLKKKTEEQERFIYTVSHDLKSPLVTINGFCGIAKEDFASGNLEQGNSSLDMVSNTAVRMQRLLDELLQISRVGVKINPSETVNLEALIKEANENVSGVISENNTEVEIEPEMPDVLVDRKYFLQVIENLLTNASKYSNSAAGGSKVKFGVIRKADELVCYFKDNGIGIETQYIEKIFDLFERVDTNSDGTGVGLAIVKRIIETQGGRIWAESDGLGHGTTFFFTVPEA